MWYMLCQSTSTTNVFLFVFTQDSNELPLLYRVIFDEKTGKPKQDSWLKIPFPKSATTFSKLRFSDVLKAIFFDQNSPEEIKKQLSVAINRNLAREAKKRAKILRREKAKKEACKNTDCLSGNESDSSSSSSSSEEEEDEKLSEMHEKLKSISSNDDGNGLSMWYDRRGNPSLSNVTLSRKGKSFLEIPLRSKISAKLSGWVFSFCFLLGVWWMCW